MTHAMITAVSSANHSGFLDQIPGDEGSFTSRGPRKKVLSSHFLGDDGEDVTPGVFELNIDDILENIGHPVGPEPTADDWSVMDVDSSTLSSLSPPTPPFPPQQVPPVLPPTKEGRGVRKAWCESKNLFMKKFWRRKTPPKLSDKLVPEREEVKWYAMLFPTSQKTTARK